MKCREFRSNHVGFIDDLLPAADMSEMRRHVWSCPKCATLDTRIRRSLLVVRNLPQIEPSADFFVRLTEALKQVPPVQRRRRPIFAAAAVTAFAAGLAAALYFVVAISPEPARKRAGERQNTGARRSMIEWADSPPASSARQKSGRC